QLTPDGKYVVAVMAMESEKAKKAIVPNYVTEASYTDTIPSREKVGDASVPSRLAVFNAGTGEVKWFEHGMKPAAPPEKSDKTVSTSPIEKEGRSSEEKTEKSAAPTAKEREVSLGLPVWSDDAANAFVTVRSADNKDAWLMAFDPATAKARVLVSTHDDAWIRFSQFEPSTGWLRDSRTIYYASEATGFMHLYTVPWTGGPSRALTSGNWEVDSIALDPSGRNFYLTTSDGSPFERHLERLPVSGGALEKLTTMAGNNEAVVAPDGTAIADLYSYTTKPPEVYVGDLKRGGAPIRVTHSPSPEFEAYPWLDVPIVRIAARDGAQVPARIYKPANWQAGGRAVVFVHGAGYLQNVHRWWSSYYREYMFHHLLMSRGYLVLDVDYRGSKGYGRDWRTAIYRHMGGKDLDDQIDAARWLVSTQGVDSKKIGVYGGSYGGFITLMALFTQPDVFASGAALRPVTDWAHYNHGYTANILNLPQTDSEAYRRSSPIYFAGGLKGRLLICHGMVDTNVHFQDTVRLVQRLIELRKTGWDLAVYPVENHGFVEPTSWADEYRRIFKLFEESLR
ncbi:MAG: prolyl oligopeptidase family serine peptidase, partial [Thermoanaerobaculia bacterium]